MWCLLEIWAVGLILHLREKSLKIQFEKGINAFKKGNMKNPYHFRTMQYREWQRGFNFAYSINLKKVKKHEIRRRGKTIHGK